MRADNPLKIDGRLPNAADPDGPSLDDATCRPCSMRPAFSVIFLTTLIGAGQGLFLALFAAEVPHSRMSPPCPARASRLQAASLARC